MSFSLIIFRKNKIISENLKIEFSHLFEKYSNDHDLLDVYWKLAKINNQIIATKNHYNSTDIDTNYLLDADLSIFGKKLERI